MIQKEYSYIAKILAHSFMNHTEEPLNPNPTNGNTNFSITYTTQEREALTKIYEETLFPVHKYEVIEGTIVNISNRDVLISIGFKSDGLVSIAEFRDIPDLKIGDKIEVYIEETEDANGQLVLSRKKAKLVKSWQTIEHALANNEVLEGLVKRRTKGGLIVEICDIETFLPGSQIDVKPVLDFDIFVDKTIDVAVIKINHVNNNVVVSHKALIEKQLEGQKAEIMNNLEQGQVLEGHVKNMTKFGAFIDLGGVDGLLHITDISWSRVNHPEEVFELGQKVKVVVVGFNEDKKRISLGMKQLITHPWDALPASVEVGNSVKGKIINIADYGIFIELITGVEGLIHISELSWSQYLRNINDIYKVGDEVEAVVLLLDRDTHKISLGIKQLTGDPWERGDFLDQYKVGTKHQGIIRNLTHFGGFIELEPGVEGLLHVSSLSWTKRITHPSELLKLNETIEIIILDIDQEQRRLSLGIKQLEENPWETCEKIFQPGSIHQGTVIKKIAKKGATIELPYGIEGFVPQHHLIKEDGTEGAIGEEIALQVIKFSKEEKRIILSHQAIINPNATDKPDKKLVQKEKVNKKNTTNNMSNFKSTKHDFGGFEAFANLKEQIANSKADNDNKEG